MDRIWDLEFTFASTFSVKREYRIQRYLLMSSRRSKHRGISLLSTFCVHMLQIEKTFSISQSPFVAVIFGEYVSAGNVKTNSE